MVKILEVSQAQLGTVDMFEPSHPSDSCPHICQIKMVTMQDCRDNQIRTTMCLWMGGSCLVVALVTQGRLMA